MDDAVFPFWGFQASRGVVRLHAGRHGGCGSVSRFMSGKFAARVRQLGKMRVDRWTMLFSLSPLSKQVGVLSDSTLVVIAGMDQ